MPKKILGKYFRKFFGKYLALGVPRVKVSNMHTWILYSYMSQFPRGLWAFEFHIDDLKFMVCTRTQGT
jgi:hypothetical protein